MIFFNSTVVRTRFTYPQNRPFRVNNMMHRAREHWEETHSRGRIGEREISLYKDTFTNNIMQNMVKYSCPSVICGGLVPGSPTDTKTFVCLYSLCEMVSICYNLCTFSHIQGLSRTYPAM